MTTTTNAQSRPRKPGSPFSLDRDLKAEIAYLVLSVGVWIGLIVTDQLVWAVAWFMATFFMFGIWRIACGRFE